VICYQREIVYVTGFSRTHLAWTIGLERDGRIIPVGIVEYGISDQVRKKVFPILQRSIVQKSKAFYFVEPRVQVAVRFRNWTSAGKMRLAVVEKVIDLW
jgi:DNA ligase-1